MSEESVAGNVKGESASQGGFASAGQLATMQLHVNSLYANEQESGIHIFPSPNSNPNTLKAKQNVRTDPLQIQPLSQIGPSAYCGIYETRTGNLFCHICRVRCLNGFNFKLHLEGQKHRNKLEEVMFGDNAKIRERCEVCKIEFMDRDTYVQHLRAQQHKDKVQDRKARRKQGMNGASEELHWCHMCKISCQNDYNLKLHLKGKKHALQLRDVEKNKKHNGGEASIMHEQHHDEGRMNSEKTDQRHWCDSCKVYFSTEHHFKQHLDGKRHAHEQAKRAKKEAPAAELEKKDSEINDQQKWCRICNVWCSTAHNLKSHLSGKKHALQLQNLDKNGGQPKQMWW